MSDGLQKYSYYRVKDLAEKISGGSPLRMAFKAHLRLVAEALHDIEWVDTGDRCPGREDAAIRACLSGDRAESESTEKKYYDTRGNACSIWQMVDGETEWTVSRIRAGEKALAEVAQLRRGLDLIMRCAGAPDPAGALYTVIEIARKALKTAGREEGGDGDNQTATQERSN